MPAKRKTSSELGFESRSAEQKEHDQENRRVTLVVALDYVRKHDLGAVGLVTLVEAVGLEDELAELAGGHPERHRRLQAAQLLVDQAVE